MLEVCSVQGSSSPLRIALTVARSSGVPLDILVGGKKLLPIILT